MASSNLQNDSTEPGDSVCAARARRLSGVLLLAGLMAAAAVMTAAVHWRVLSAQALSFDDNEFLTQNALVRNPSWTSVGRFFGEVLEPSTVEGYYLPLSMTSLMVDYALGGRPGDLRQFHRTSLTLHVLNTLLVIAVLYALFGEVVPAALVGVLFGAHPLTVEPVAWVGERKTLLATFFGLWCLLCYVRYARQGSWKWLALSAVSYVLAVLSKPTAVPIPVLLLLMDYWPLKRLSRRVLLEKVPHVALGILLAAITFISHARTSGFIESSESPLVRAPLLAGYLNSFYLGKIVWPATLSSVYPLPEPLSLSNATVLHGVAATCVLAVVLALALSRTRALLSGWLFFLIAISPTLGVVQYSWITASDKYVYTPFIGLLMVLAWALCWMWKRCDDYVRFGRVIVVAVVLLLFAAEARRVRQYLVKWHDSETLYQHMLTVAPGSSRVRNNLGNILLAQGRLDEAIEIYEHALKANPQAADAHHNLGSALAMRGRLGEAVAHFHQALEIKPDYASAHKNMGVALIRMRQLDEALVHFRAALEIEPDCAECLDGAAWILATHPNAAVRKPEEAIKLAEKAAELTQNQNPAILNTLATAYAAAGQFDRAANTVKMARELAVRTGNHQLAAVLSRSLENYSRRAREQRQPTP